MISRNCSKFQLWISYPDEKLSLWRAVQCLFLVVARGIFHSFDTEENKERTLFNLNDVDELWRVFSRLILLIWAYAHCNFVVKPTKDIEISVSEWKRHENSFRISMEFIKSAKSKFLGKNHFRSYFFFETILKKNSIYLIHSFVWKNLNFLWFRMIDQLRVRIKQ